MLAAWTAADVRAAEAPLLAAGVPLMRRAAHGLHLEVVRVLRGRRHTGPGGRAGRTVPLRGAHVAVLAGAGNNGGDALHAAALLAARGVRVTVLPAAARLHDEGLAAARAAGVGVLDADEVTADPAAAAALAAGADVVLDGLVGIGADGSGLRGTAQRLVAALLEALEGLEAPEAMPGAAGRVRPVVVAVDVPSGIGVDDGRLAGTVLPADRTVTFGVPKAGLLLPPASGVVGALVTVDLGLDLSGRPPAVRRLEDDDVRALWPVPGRAAQKYARGVLGVVTGTTRYPGAAVLSVSGAVGAGVGMVRFVDERPPSAPDAGTATPAGPLAAAVLAARPEVVVAAHVGDGRVQAWAAGSGVDPADPARAAAVADVLRAAAAGVPAVLDAGALEHVGPGTGAHVVLTPHAGELAALLARLGERTDDDRPVDRDAVEAEPWRWAGRAHARTGATVLLKGATTLVVGPGGTWSQADAPAWLATAGAGDVLAGVLGTLLAARADALADDPSAAARLAAAAALVHGRAAHAARPGGPVAAAEVAHAVPDVVAALLAGRPASSGAAPVGDCGA
ncbi:bifunctional ADP-dependent NAD(P)H-hydrate dehydratase/NAD(P)H-hydrate epimerase [Cellulomonas endophytica]|uniref:bifunctional ADP-dependent NAD(P)H-hydrate dehydratase/NAD(P)H-hydrate epimerase n=1 Tax=Cellulomonas endophytica TaxID=2494735 RepID=UPI001011F45A|nr:bifunctional ADP-dependent NAD(P)H-hydrate dehydratase/NAD(P)H-hydrate epimerase [Cellulomonas endophytica]